MEAIKLKTHLVNLEGTIVKPNSDNSSAFFNSWVTFIEVAQFAHANLQHEIHINPSLTKMKKYIFVILMGLVSLQLYSQVIISGKVSGKEGTLAGANVYIEGSYDGTSANADGEFSFKTSKTGRVIIKAHFLGYELFIKEIELAGFTVKLEILLTETFNKLYLTYGRCYDKYRIKLLLKVHQN